MTTQQTTREGWILLVDDEEDSLYVLSAYLTKQGYNVHAFSSPQIAYEHFRYSPQECLLVISDVRMPGMNGLQLARKVKELSPDVKVVLTSSFEIDMSESQSILPNAPVDCFLDKPFSLKKLTDVVTQQVLV